MSSIIDDLRRTALTCPGTLPILSRVRRCSRGPSEHRKGLLMKPAIRALLDDSHPAVDRRSFFKRLGIGAGAAIAMTGEPAAAAAADFVQSNVNRASEPSALKITDLRVAV